MFKGKIRRYIKNGLLTKNEKKIAEYIMNNYGETLALKSIKELAHDANVSISAVSRFFMKMNVAGYKGFINTIISENNKSNNHLLSNEIQSIIKTKTLIMSSKFEKLAEIINTKQRVKLYSSGFAKYIAQNFQRQLNKINIKTEIGDIYNVGNIFPENEVHLFISFSGINNNFIKVIRKLESFDEKLTMFSITSTSHSNIKKYVLDHIHGSVYSDGLIANEKELPTITSRVMHYILDKLFEKVYNINHEKNDKLISKIK